MEKTDWSNYKLSLEAARVNANMTQAELAAKMLVSRRTLGKWETGENAINPGNMMLFASLVGVDLDHIRLPERRTQKKFT